MSPPQADLQTKPDPYLIDQVSESRMASEKSTKKTKIIAGAILVSLVIVGCIVFGSLAYSYRLFYKTEYKAESRIDGEKIPEHIYVDYKKELIYVNNKKAGRVDGMRALHNYNRKLVALYDETQNICLIDRLDEDFDGGLKYWSKYGGSDSNQQKMTFEYSKDPIEPKVLKRFAGEEVALHCAHNNATAHWMYASKPYDGTLDTKETESHDIEKRALVHVPYGCNQGKPINQDS
ncbi:hypothetical protein LOTGIDRAFT_238649 [Lottia gigantea]|uniref:BRICHOS domain-containing protein n=1 Tax=Lottia gigantea TaxID=225164 RepID=V4A8A9_LOTGI|nr:hypothetical protein LOTGIDRAFT_238649 [Lottia gigantea]ESP00204.1 hypothetical protein LOTGIDRAFT_238649 [Lottia gigantea]